MATVFPDRGITVQKVINRALRVLKVLGEGETLSAQGSTDALDTLNALIDEWANEKLMVSGATLDQITLTPNVATYTIGATGGTVSNYPITIDEASYIQYGSLSYPLQLLTLEQYNALTLKSLSTLIPDSLWYNPTFPNGTITLYPTPAAVMTLNLWSWKQIASFTSLTNLIALPPGYENALVYNLAVMQAPEYGVQVTNDIARIAMNSKTKLKRVNFVPVILKSDVGDAGYGRFNILGGSNL